MKTHRASHMVATAAICAAFPLGLLADVKLPAIISDNMVLQAGAKDRIWGKAEPGEAVEVSFASQCKKAVAGKDGRWGVELDPMKASSESATLTVAGKNRIEVKNVLVGEVWLGSGQSNMEFVVKGALDAQKEIAKADYPLIRHFAVRKALSSQPQDDCEGKWEICSPKTAAGFSAVMYFFARDLFEAHRLPVGLLHSSWGGSPIQSWMPKEILTENQGFARKIEIPDASYADLKTYNDFRAETIAKFSVKDAGSNGEAEGWAKPGIASDGWKEAAMPQTMERFFEVDFDGSAWFRKEIDIPANWAGKDVVAQIGPTTSAMTVYLNGEKVFTSDANIDEYIPNAKLPAKLVKAGANLLAIRYFNHIGAGGMAKPNATQFKMRGPDGNELTLAGKWLGRIEQKLAPAKIPFALPVPRDMPGGLYNAMIAPLLNFNLRGALWYQGESNAGNPMNYSKMLEAMIKSWRGKFGDPEMPFYFVQLANFGERSPTPIDPHWAQLREQQRETLSVPNTAMAVTIDIGDPKNIHPRNKQDVGKRLALPARRFCYGEKDLEHSGPVLESMEAKDGALVLKFSHAKGGLAAKGGELKSFAISEDGQAYVWAQAKIAGDSVALSAPEFKNPKFVRYAWDSDPESAIYNKEGLPASPFKASLK